jgi:hypothetical protein
MLLTTHDYNSVCGTLANSHNYGLQSDSISHTLHAQSPLSLLSLTSPWVLASNGGRSPSWVHELHHSSSTAYP